ncbi:MAG: aldehyde dehydrogenase family protein [Myxococcota bacterium]|nr:aldehyde dehydrogenase family protein [Myxococcota bacterium]
MAIVTAIAAEGDGRRKLQLKSPATLRNIGEIEVQTASDVQRALERAKTAQKKWANVSLGDRAKVLSRALQILVEQHETYIDVFVEESGKVPIEALMIEIYAACDTLHFCASRGPKLLKSRRQGLHGVFRILKTLHINYHPLGVVGVISPWNGPFILSLGPVAQALMAGNAVLLKPSEVTPRSGGLVGKLFEDAGLPSGLLTVLQGDGETGAALVEAGLDKIRFTGSINTGFKVAVSCAKQLIPCALELGGKDPMIVCADADLDLASGGAVAGAVFNTGQYCCGTERIYVVESVADRFIELVVEKVKALRIGHEGEFDVGAIFWQKQLDIIERHVADAVERGAKVLVGGRRCPNLEGLYYEPTVLIDVDHSMMVMTEETFGPILPIVRVRDEEEGLRLANDSKYGLSANVWSKDDVKAVALAGRIESGTVCVNDMSMAYGVLEAPFGGRKLSGVGQVHGDEGLRSYTFAQSILVDRFGGKPTKEQYYPYTKKKFEDTQKAIRFFWGNKLGRWFST